MTTTQSIRVRIGVMDPPPGVAFRVQRGRSDLHHPSTEDRQVIAFDLAVRLGRPQVNGKPNFLGEFTQGPPQDRFIYVNSGLQAGQEGSCWDRRAKVKLSGIDDELVRRALSEADSWLEARFAGTAPDGGPACGTVSLLGGGWQLRRGRTA